MFVHIWRMRARKKRTEEYEKFGRQVTLPSLRKIDGCLGAHFIRMYQARKPEYLWLVFWRDHKALEQARTNPLWREQIKRFEAGKFYKSIPLELVCETVESFSATLDETQARSQAVQGRQSCGGGRAGNGSNGKRGSGGVRSRGVFPRRDARPHAGRRITTLDFGFAILGREARGWKRLRGRDFFPSPQSPAPSPRLWLTTS